MMSHRYRIAFHETLCGKKKGYYNTKNGFVREQSSFRETTIDRSILNGSSNCSHYDNPNLVSIGAFGGMPDAYLSTLEMGSIPRQCSAR